MRLKSLLFLSATILFFACSDSDEPEVPVLAKRLTIPSANIENTSIKSFEYNTDGQIVKIIDSVGTNRVETVILEYSGKDVISSSISVVDLRGLTGSTQCDHVYENGFLKEKVCQTTTTNADGISERDYTEGFIWSDGGATLELVEDTDGEFSTYTMDTDKNPLSFSGKFIGGGFIINSEVTFTYGEKIVPNYTTIAAINQYPTRLHNKLVLNSEAIVGELTILTDREISYTFNENTQGQVSEIIETVKETRTENGVTVFEDRESENTWTVEY